MINIKFNLIIFILCVMILPVGITLGRTIADVDCKGTNEKLVYNCIITLSEMKTNNKIEQAEFKVGADMPSMPGVHNVKPVIAHPMGVGMYRVKLNLEMYGEWVLKMDFTKPRRDRIVKKIIFGESGQKMSHDHDGGKKHKEVIKMSHGHDRKHEHKKKGMPMKHEHKN